MENSNDLQFKTAIDRLSEAFPRQLNATTYDVYWEALKDKPIESIERACKYLAREHPKNMFPTPFEIREACSASFVPPPQQIGVNPARPSVVLRIQEPTITPKERRWNKMILNLTLETMAQSTPTNPKYVNPENIEAHARSVGFDPEFIEIQMKHYFKALDDLGCDYMGRPK